MKVIRFVLALIVFAVGLLWTLQGAGLVGGSFMTGERQWLYTGILAMLIGLAGLLWAGRSRG
mgnify:FL=1